MAHSMSRRDVLAGALAAGGAAAAGALPSIASPDLVAEATREGTVAYLSAGDIALVQKIGKAFEAKYPGIRFQGERIGAERIFQRLDQEYSRGIHNVDVVDSSDVAHFLVWKQRGWLARHVPDDVARFWPQSERDPDGMYATFRASMAIMGHNTKLVPPDAAPRGYADLLDPRWRGRLIKAHPGYSGTVATQTFLLVREFGWKYLEELAKQRVLQVQSATEPPKKLALGERPVMVEGTDYVLFDLQEKGSPLEAIYPVEGCPLVPIPTGVLDKAPHPNAGRLFRAFLYTREVQQMLIDVGNTRSFHPQITEKAGRRPIGQIKLWRADPEQLLAQLEEIRRKYTEIFKV